MKTIWDVLDKPAMRSEPRVWIKRLIIVDQRGERARFIQDIPLKRGLNIVWAKEPEEDGSTEPVTGHSAGKTSFCRLLRYCMGESTYATKENKKLLAKCFKYGYVGADLVIDGKHYAVLRPIGDGTSSYCSSDMTLDELVKEPGAGGRVFQHNYAEKLGLRNLLEENLSSSSVLKTGEEIKYEHILAWCTRDQEARYQNIYTWRSSRSESDTPAFGFKKEGPLFAMRVILSLFLPEELKKEELLAEKQKRQIELEKLIEDKRKEPLYLSRRYRNELAEKLVCILGGERKAEIESAPIRDPGDLIFDLERLKNKAAEEMERQSDDLAEKRAGIQAAINERASAIRHLNCQLSEFSALVDAKTRAELNLDEDFIARQKDRKLISDVWNSSCIAGILYKDCEQVKQRMKALHFLEPIDGHQREQEEARRAEEISAVKKQLDVIRAQRFRLSAEKLQLHQDEKQIQQEITALPASSEGLNTLFGRVLEWDEYCREPHSYSELTGLYEELKTVGEDSSTLQKELAEMIHDHAESRKLLDSVFSGSVGQVLPSSEYIGQVTFDQRDLCFNIIRGTTISGEAITTLSVLLADVSCMLYAGMSERVKLPGFVLHDSPREADLGMRLYRNYFRFIRDLENHFGGAESCPFQYIITTTTPPPPEMEDDETLICLKLNAGIPEELLFRRNLSEPVDEPDIEELGV